MPLLLAALALLGLATAATAQQAEAPIRGTIAVADDAEDPALARITAEQAQAAALAAVAGARFHDVDLDEEGGFLVYEVELHTDAEEVEVLVDAGDGSVLRVEREAADRD